MAAEILVLVRCWKSFEVLLGLGYVAGALQGARQLKLRRCMEGVNREGLLENFDLFVELLQLSVADAFEVLGIGVARIELDGILKAGQRGIDLVVGMLRQAKVVPGLRIVRVERERCVQGFLGLIELLQGHQRDAFIDRGLRQLRVFLEGLGEACSCLLCELLAHLRDALVVQADRLRVEVRLRRQVCTGTRKACSRNEPAQVHPSLAQISLRNARGVSRTIQCMRASGPPAPSNGLVLCEESPIYTSFCDLIARGHRLAQLFGATTHARPIG